MFPTCFKYIFYILNLVLFYILPYSYFDNNFFAWLYNRYSQTNIFSSLKISTWYHLCKLVWWYTKKVNRNQKSVMLHVRSKSEANYSYEACFIEIWSMLQVWSMTTWSMLHMKRFCFMHEACFIGPMKHAS